MKTALLTLLAVHVLLLAHITPSTSRPMDRNSFDGSTVSLNRVLNEESTQALPYFLRENMNSNLDRGPWVLVSLSREAPERLLTGHQMTLKELAHFLGTLYPLFQGPTSSAEEVVQGSLEEFSERLKREGPLSPIDPTFQLLTKLNENAKGASRKEPYHLRVSGLIKGSNDSSSLSSHHRQQNILTTKSSRPLCFHVGRPSKNSSVRSFSALLT